MLDFIDLIHKGEAKPTKTFTESLVSKMNSHGTKEELELLGIIFDTKETVKNLKKTLTNALSDPAACQRTKKVKPKPNPPKLVPNQSSDSESAENTSDPEI